MATSNKKGFVNKITKKTALKVLGIAQLPYEKMGKWIPTGSGNYDNIKDDGRYRASCDTIHYELQCEHDPKSKKNLFVHCNKLDCISCFITGCSLKARKLNKRLQELRRMAYVHNITLGRVLHISLLLNTHLEEFNTYKRYSAFKRSVIYPLLKKLGIIGGILFLHLWSVICLNCGDKYYDCTCIEKHLERKINIHLHVVGFGYLMNAGEFKDTYPNWVYRNHLPRRDNAYYTIFYILSKAALWRNTKGTLMPSYTYFGYLHQSKLRVTHEHRTKMTDNCPECNQPFIINKILDKHPQRKLYYTIKVPKKEYSLQRINDLRDIVEKLYPKLNK
ncbi:MAG: hypothetical protein ACXABO_11255 [Promethearchaeota archaeon]|jgi:hypothetical protein